MSEEISSNQVAGEAALVLRDDLKLVDIEAVHNKAARAENYSGWPRI